MPTPSWTAHDLAPDDLVAAALRCRETLTPALDRDWETFAVDMEWTCRHTISGTCT